MKSPLETCKRYYPKIYKLWNEGNDECKMIAYNIYYHNYGSTFDKDIADYCETIGFHVRFDDSWGSRIYYIS